VCDLEGRVTLLNPAAERILGLPAKRAKGRSIREFLPAYPDRRFRDTEAITIEISQGAGQELRHYILDISLLTDWRDLPVGCLTLLHDVTEQKAVQAQLLEQQRALAIFSEREMLAREMHDGLGQVLGYIKMQTQAARDCLARDQIATAEEHLAQLTAVAQDAHADVREYIMGAKTTATGQPGFLPALQQYLQRFSENYRLRTELVGPDGWSDGILGATVEAQLLRIIQEALTNTRKHAQARSAQVILHRNNDRLQVIVQDDGVGFDPARLENGEGQKYGLGFLRERAALVGGSVEIQSTPGKGTRVMVEVPLNP
ncbi:MAG: histidine kinase, partial [Anaerolineales bacterium]|nr:histidine kinase [Anaerolineales bacterium]